MGSSDSQPRSLKALQKWVAPTFIIPIVLFHLQHCSCFFISQFLPSPGSPSTNMQLSWQEIAAAKRASLQASIPSEWLIPPQLMPAEDVLDVTTFPKTSGLFTAEELHILDSGAADIYEKISKGAWTAEKVTIAFCKSAAVAHQLVRDLELNCRSQVS